MDADARTHAGQRDLRVMFVGDSTVAGVGDPAGQGWVGRAVAGAFAAGMPLTAYNLGVRRDTSADVLARWHTEAHARFAPGADCRVVFSFGTNDATVEHGARRVPEQQSLANLADTLDGAAAVGLPTLFVGPAPVEEPEHRDRIVALSGAFAQLAAARGVPYIEVVRALAEDPTWTREAREGDGAHPGSGGYSLLAGLVMERWLAWLAEGAAGESIQVPGSRASGANRLR
jgi:acyl-CoA thioesterase-1